MSPRSEAYRKPWIGPPDPPTPAERWAEHERVSRERAAECRLRALAVAEAERVIDGREEP